MNDFTGAVSLDLRHWLGKPICCREQLGSRT
jgi:hypothetical protein